jgi:hypothetical protein
MMPIVDAVSLRSMASLISLKSHGGIDLKAEPLMNPVAGSCLHRVTPLLTHHSSRGAGHPRTRPSAKNKAYWGGSGFHRGKADCGYMHTCGRSGSWLIGKKRWRRHGTINSKAYRHE